MRLQVLGMSGARHNVTATRVAPGLVIHPSVGTRKSGGINRRWTVTHEPSGYAVWSPWPSEAAARRFADMIAPLADWTLPADLLLPSAGTRTSLRTKLYRQIKEQAADLDAWLIRQDVDRDRGR